MVLCGEGAPKETFQMEKRFGRNESSKSNLTQ